VGIRAAARSGNAVRRMSSIYEAHVVSDLNISGL
jgi:hypothetical protein